MVTLLQMVSMRFGSVTRLVRGRGKLLSTQVGEYVREEMAPAENGTKGMKSRKLTIAIGLSKDRQEGVNVRRKTRAV